MGALQALSRDLDAMLGVDGLVPMVEVRPFEVGYRYGDGRAAAVARPVDTDQVRQILRYCYRHDVRVVAQGANTGLVGASVPDDTGEQLLLSLGRLQTTSLDSSNLSMNAGAGARLSCVNTRANKEGLFFPIDLGADPSIGGMVATNTGGSRMVRYGDVRANTLGLEVVLADEDGTVLSDLRGLRKDNSAFDLMQIFIGSGGGLGVITAASVALQPLPRQTATALVALADPQAASAVASSVQHALGELMSACEGMSRNAIEVALKHTPSLPNPFQAEFAPAYTLLIEASSCLAITSGLSVQEQLEASLASLLEERDDIEDVLIGRGDGFWRLRHAISDSLRKEGVVLGFDLSFPRGRLSPFRDGLKVELDRDFPFLRVCDFGHVADGGDHFNIVWPYEARPFDAVTAEAIRDLVYDHAVFGHGGSYSAEHGVGPHNEAYYHRYVSAEQRSIAESMRRVLDPKGLLGRVAHV